MPEATKRGRKRAANAKDAAESNGKSTVEDQADDVQDQADDQSDRGPARVATSASR